jgi:hypothetical protein
MNRVKRRAEESEIHGWVHPLTNTERIFLWGVRSKIAVVAMGCLERIFWDMAKDTFFVSWAGPYCT